MWGLKTISSMLKEKYFLSLRNYFRLPNDAK
jgi:hypothetical protein